MYNLHYKNYIIFVLFVFARAAYLYILTKSVFSVHNCDYGHDVSRWSATSEVLHLHRMALPRNIHHRSAHPSIQKQEKEATLQGQDYKLSFILHSNQNTS